MSKPDRGGRGRDGGRGGRDGDRGGDRGGRDRRERYKSRYHLFFIYNYYLLIFIYLYYQYFLFRNVPYSVEKSTALNLDV